MTRMTKEITNKADKLKYLRAYLGLTQKEFAERVGCAPNTLLRAKKNSCFSGKIQNKITTALNLPNDFFDLPMIATLTYSKVWNQQLDNERFKFLLLYSGKKSADVIRLLDVSRQYVSFICLTPNFANNLRRKITDCFQLSDYFFTCLVETHLKITTNKEPIIIKAVLKNGK